MASSTTTTTIPVHKHSKLEHEALVEPTGLVTCKRPTLRLRCTQHSRQTRSTERGPLEVSRQPDPRPRGTQGIRSIQPSPDRFNLLKQNLLALQTTKSTPSWVPDYAIASTSSEASQQKDSSSSRSCRAADRSWQQDAAAAEMHFDTVLV